MVSGLATSSDCHLIVQKCEIIDWRSFACAVEGIMSDGVDTEGVD